jgi:hypothetical protein
MACGGRLPASLLAALLLPAAFQACRREDPRIRALTEKAAEADEAADQLREAWSAQFRRFGLAKLPAPPAEEGPLFLTEAQKRALEVRVHQERDTSRRGLLREILDQDAELRALAARLADLKAALPAPDLVRPNDSHYGLALRFLLGRGLSEAQARQTLSRVPIFERLLPGFEVYHFYADGAYGTWVSRGRAPVSPRDFARLDPELPTGERDMALARGRHLQRELGLLEEQKRSVEREIAAIQAERTDLLEGRAGLQSEHSRQEARLNALHYLVGVRDALEREGVIEIPLFGKDHSGRAWSDALFTQSLDLRTGTRLVLRAQDLGLRQIGRVSVVPGSYLPDEHYRLSLSADRQTATVDLLVPSRFRNDKVVFAVAE